MSLALACDLIVAASDARFVMSYAKVGFSPDGGSTWHLGRALPRALALEWVWLAEPQTAERLWTLGLVNRLAEPGQALAMALQLARQLSAMAPNAVACAKELIQAAPNRPLPQHLDEERDAFVANLFHDNGGEGLAAFFAKRRPAFK
jgi:enoyl-CoA hydratase/carnithine racemase